MSANEEPGPVRVFRFLSASCFYFAYKLRVWPLLAYFVIAALLVAAWHFVIDRIRIDWFSAIPLAAVFVFIPGYLLITAARRWLNVPSADDLKQVLNSEYERL